MCMCHTHIHNVHTGIDTTAVSPVHISLAGIVSIVIVELFVIMENYLRACWSDNVPVNAVCDCSRGWQYCKSWSADCVYCGCKTHTLGGFFWSSSVNNWRWWSDSTVSAVLLWTIARMSVIPLKMLIIKLKLVVVSKTRLLLALRIARYLILCLELQTYKSQCDPTVHVIN